MIRRKHHLSGRRSASFSLLIVSIASCAITAELEAATFLVDFGGTGNQTTAADSNGNNWNNLTGANANNMVNPRSGTILLQDTTGITTGGVSMAYSFPDTGDDFGNKDATVHSSLGSLSNLGLLNIDSVSRDVIWSQGTYTLTFTGLDETKMYDFTLFTYRASVGRETNYALEGLNASSVNGFAVSTSNAGNGVIVPFLNKSPDEFGSMILTVSPGAGTYAYLSALQISEVPEPSSAALLLGGLSAIFLKRRR